MSTTTDTTTTVTTTTVTSTITSSGSNTNVTFSSADLAVALNNAATVTVNRIPQFWTSSPEAWFVQTEAQFEIGRVTQDFKRYSYLLAALPLEVLEKVLDVVKEPPENNKYENLKKILLERFSLSEEKRISNLLYKEEIGDRSPSEFFRHLQILAGSSDSARVLAKKIWLDRLPSPIDVAVIPLSGLEQSVILSTADKIWERTKSRISAVSNNPFTSTLSSSNDNQDLRQEVNELKAMIEKLSVRFERQGRERSRSRSSSRRRFRSRPRSDSPSSPVCWYHRKFGKNSTKCAPPCTFNDKNSESKK